MLLETLDIKKNDILIYSQNIFDLENNFKIIFKDDQDKTPQKISYGDVCRFVNEFNPKNMIVYRLLTNIPDFEVFLSRYGFFLNINSVTELIYFDPVFAVKELEEYSKTLEYDLRFRIQQVGLTTLNRFKNLPNFAEIYSVDMQAVEAKNQNDKVFADAIFSVERQSFKRELNPIRKNTEKNTILKNEGRMAPKELHKNQVDPKIEANTNKINKNTKADRNALTEDKDFDYRQIMKINFKGATSEMLKKSSDVKAEQKKNIEVYKGTHGDSSFGKFLESRQINQNSKDSFSLGDVPKNHLTDIFKSPSSLKNLVEGKEDKKIVLKLNKR